MKNPWDEEPTPLCHKAKLSDDETSVVPAEFAEDLERRLRHAWKLVNSLRIDAMNAQDMDETAEYELGLAEIESRLSDIEETLQ